MILFGVLITTEKSFKDRIREYQNTQLALQRYAEGLLKAIDQRDKEIQDYETIVKAYREKLREARITNSITIEKVENE